MWNSITNKKLLYNKMKWKIKKCMSMCTIVAGCKIRDGFSADITSLCHDVKPRGLLKKNIYICIYIKYKKKFTFINIHIYIQQYNKTFQLWKNSCTWKKFQLCMTFIFRTLYFLSCFFYFFSLCSSRYKLFLLLLLPNIYTHIYIYM